MAYVYACFVHMRHGVYKCICTSLTSCSNSFGALKSLETFSEAFEHLDHQCLRISDVTLPFFSRVASLNLRKTLSVSPYTVGPMWRISCRVVRIIQRPIAVVAPISTGAESLPP